MFIVIEGGDGAGKTTVQQGLKEYFIKQGHSPKDVIITSDLAGTALGEQVRQVFLSDALTTSSETDMLLMSAARVQNLQEKIIPALEKGKIVICDRFIDTTYAYQVNAGGGSVDFFRRACESILPVQPDLSLILDLDPEIAFDRAKRRGELDKIERKGIDFMEKVREGLLSRSYLPGRRVVNADQSPDKVIEDCVALIRHHSLAKKKVRSAEDLAPSCG